MFGDKTKRAKKEIGVISSLILEYDSKINVCNRSVNDYLVRMKDFNNQYEKLEINLDNTSDDIEKRRIMNEQDRINMLLIEIESRVDNLEHEIRDYRNIRLTLAELKNNAMSLLDKNPKFIIKMIPEKKLPKLIKNSEKIVLVQEITKGLLIAFREESNRLGLNTSLSEKELSQLLKESSNLEDQIDDKTRSMREAKRAEHLKKLAELDQNEAKQEHKRNSEDKKLNLS